ncbi:MAG: type II/IV secretion system ATPase subunit [Candidatus Woesearchaeota archaeon]
MGFITKIKEKTAEQAMPKPSQKVALSGMASPGLASSGGALQANAQQQTILQQQQQLQNPMQSAAQRPNPVVYTIDHTAQATQQSGLREKIATSYDRVLYRQEQSQDQQSGAMQGFESSHKVIQTEQATYITTILDTVLDTIKAQQEITFKKLSQQLRLDPLLLEYWLGILERHNYVKLYYPFNIFSDVRITYNAAASQPKQGIVLPADKELLDSYMVSSDHVVARIMIWGTKSKDIPFYQIIVPQIGEGTKALMEELISKISEDFSVELEELTDKKKKEALIERFFVYAKGLFAKKLPQVNDDFLDVLVGTMLHTMYGLGEMEIIMADNWVEEIAINGSHAPVCVYHKRFGWVKTSLRMEHEEEIYNFASRIGRNIGREINSLNPIMDAHLTTGDRVAATLFPVSSLGNTITIRRFSRNPWSIVTMIDPAVNTLSVEMAALLWLAMQYELNIIVAGGTASGKTSMLNSVVAMIPPKQRVLSIEDTRELFLPKDLHWNWVPMTTRKANPEGKGEITMLDLMVASLRMRPDRIVVGEIRRKEQAETLFETMHTGHSVYATMHADTVEQVERRLLEPPIQIPKTELGALHLIIIQYRDRRRGMRKTLEIAEVLSAEGEDSGVQFNYLYRWRPRTDTFEKINESIRVVQDLNLHTGMTPEEIKQDLKDKEMILSWLLAHRIKDVDAVGKIMKIYYATPQTIIAAAQQNTDPRAFF